MPDGAVTVNVVPFEMSEIVQTNRSSVPLGVTEGLS
jgi:hypothetical protein